MLHCGFPIGGVGVVLGHVEVHDHYLHMLVLPGAPNVRLGIDVEWALHDLATTES